MWDRGPTLELESGFEEFKTLANDLEQRGHVVEPVFKVAGGMNGIGYDLESGLMEGAACWRADGAPIGVSGGDAQISVDPNEAAMWV